jgi:mono/diheme cytochrome c family protein
MRRSVGVLAAIILSVGAMTAMAAIDLPPGPNRDLVYGNCRTCHDLQYLEESKGITRDDWSAALDAMHQYGLRLQPGDRAKILDYLATYLGPHPPPAHSGANAAATERVDGRMIFSQQCSACHQGNGRGVPGQFPPLAGNRDLFLSHDYPVLVVLHGLTGNVTIGGKTFNGTMPSFAYLSDAQIAAVVGYVRSAWGNDALRPAGMLRLRASAVSAARARVMSSSDVHDYRRKRE